MPRAREGHDQRVGADDYAYGVLHSPALRDLVLQSVDFGPEDEVARLHHADSWAKKSVTTSP